MTLSSLVYSLRKKKNGEMEENKINNIYLLLFKSMINTEWDKKQIS